MPDSPFSLDRWNFFRFYSFFWIWFVPGHYLVRSHLKYNNIRESAGLDTSINFPYFLILFLCIMSSYNIIINKPVLSYEDRHINDFNWSSITNKIFSFLRSIGMIFGAIILFLSGLTIETIISDCLNNNIDYFRDVNFSLYYFLKYDFENVLEILFIFFGMLHFFIYGIAVSGGRLSVPPRPGHLGV